MDYNWFSLKFHHKIFQVAWNDITTNRWDKLGDKNKLIVTPNTTSSYNVYPPTIRIEKTEMKEVKNTQNVAEAAALWEGIPISSHSGVSTVPPPNLYSEREHFNLPKPTKPPRKPAIKLPLRV